MIIAIAGKKRTGKDTVARILESQGFKSIALAQPFKQHIADMICGAFPAVRPKFGRQLTDDDVFGFTDFDRDKEVIFDYNSFKEISLGSIEAFRGYIPETHRLRSMSAAEINMFISEIMSKENASEYTIRRLMQFIGTDLWVNHIDRFVWTKIAFHKIYSSKHSDWVITDCRQQHELNEMRSGNVRVIGINRPGIELSQDDDHITERGLELIPGIDPVILNDGSLEDLENKVVRCLEHLRGHE